LSEPPGCAVYLNGEPRGVTSAEGKLQIERLPQGHYAVELRKDGYHSTVRGFEAGAESPTLVFKLEPNLELFSKEFDSLIEAGKLDGPESPNAFVFVSQLLAKFPARPEIARMQGVLAAKLAERNAPVIERTITSWRTVTREELVRARDGASDAATLKDNDNRIQAQAAYLRAMVALWDWLSDDGKPAEAAAEADGLMPARTEIEKAVGLDNAWGSAWYSFGVVRLYSGDASAAEAAFLKAVQLEPRWAVAHSGLGSAYYAGGKYKEAIEAHRKAIELNRTYAAAYAGLGLARAAKGEKDGVKDIRRAMELDPASGLPHLYLGMVYSKSKKKDEVARAASELKMAIEKNEQNRGLEFLSRTAEQLISQLQAPKRK
jgi:tetratricopeptide (TPR) repeat protein